MCDVKVELFLVEIIIYHTFIYRNQNLESHAWKVKAEPC